MTSKSRGGPPPLIPPNPCLIPPQPPLPPPPSPMPTASLTVKGQIGEYKLEVNSQEGLEQLVQVVEKFADRITNDYGRALAVSDTVAE